MATKTEPRLPLSRDRILQAALELTDEGGIESLTMRKLGQALGFEAMSLYNHVANKDDVLDGILDLVLAESEPPAPEGDWDAAIRASAVSVHDALRRHPWACMLLMSHVHAGADGGPRGGVRADDHRRRVPAPPRTCATALRRRAPPRGERVRVRPRPDPRRPQEDLRRGLASGRACPQQKSESDAGEARAREAVLGLAEWRRRESNPRPRPHRQNVYKLRLPFRLARTAGVQPPYRRASHPLVSRLRRLAFLRRQPVRCRR